MIRLAFDNTLVDVSFRVSSKCVVNLICRRPKRPEAYGIQLSKWLGRIMIWVIVLNMEVRNIDSDDE